VLFEEFDGALKVRRNVVYSSAYLFPKSDPNIFDEPQVSARLLTQFQAVKAIVTGTKTREEVLALGFVRGTDTW